MDPARLGGVLRARGIEGVIVMPFGGDVPQGRLDLAMEGFSAIAIGYSVTEPHLHRVAPDQFQAAMLAFERMRDLGYRRVGFALHTVADIRTGHRFLSAYSYQLRATPRARRIPMLAFDSADEKKAARQFFLWLRRCRPDVVVCNQLTPLNWLLEKKTRLPEQLGFAVLDRSPGITSCSGVDQQMEEVGAAAVEQVVGLIQRSERGVPEHPRTVLIEPRWVAGDTTREISAPDGRAEALGRARRTAD